MNILSAYEQKHLILTRDCDILGVWRPDAIFTAMQETSGMHSHMLGVDHDGILPKSVIWVLYRKRLDMLRDARIGETVTIRTYPTRNLRMFYPRHFLVYGEDGALMASSSTLWLMMDWETRRMTTHEAVNRRLLEIVGDEPPLERPDAVAPLTTGQAQTMERVSMYSDMDINGHVNNARYVSWLCDMLGIDCLRGHRIETLLVNYRAEIRPDVAVTLQLTRKGNDFSMEASHEDQPCFACSGRLAPRQ